MKTPPTPPGRPLVRFDFDAVNRWAHDAARKPAMHAFTAGLERKVALLIERAARGQLPPGP